jgi:hypothetical protein
MKIIPRNIHGIIDYIVGVALISAPWSLGFADGGMATYVPVALGIGTLFYSILTNYEVGVVKLIPFRIHLTLDVLSGLLLAASPWLFGFASHVYLPHVLIGAFEIVAGFTTKNEPDHIHHADGVRHG